MGAWINARALRPAHLTPPVSKSDAQRAAVLDWLAGRALIDDTGAPRDVRVLVAGLAALQTTGDTSIDCADGGTPLRILLAQAAIREGTTTFSGSERLGAREHRPLLDALRRTLGVAIPATSAWPLVVRGTSDRATVPTFTVDASASSQFATSLLLACAALTRREGRPWRLALIGEPASAGYLALTHRWLQHAGYRVTHHGEVTLEADRSLPAPPRDWSSAAYLLLVAWKSGSTVDVDLEHPHPDRAIVPILRQVGLEVSQTSDGVRVSGTPTRGAEVSGRTCPDLLPTIAALATALPGPTRLLHTDILRGKESDRLTGLIRMVEGAGARVTGDADALVIHPGAVPTTLRVDVANDHRAAMSAAVLAAVTGSRVHIDDRHVVEKSFPAFWTELSLAGIHLS